jgi:hypothetical protein
MARSVSGLLDQARFAFDKGPANRSALLIRQAQVSNCRPGLRQDHITEITARKLIAPVKFLSLLAKPN